MENFFLELLFSAQLDSPSQNISPRDHRDVVFSSIHHSEILFAIAT